MDLLKMMHVLRPFWYLIPMFTGKLWDGPKPYSKT